MFFCNHKYGKVNKDGYQYCTKCGKAIVAPVAECQHDFETVAKHEKYRRHIYTGEKVIQQYVYVLQCTKCGIMKQEIIRSD